MELITALLTGFLSALSLGGIVADQTAASAITARVNRVENIQVRIDNAPNLQILNGKADRVRMSAKGVWLTKELRIDGFELETDPISIDPKLLQGDPAKIRLESLPRPLQAGVKISLTESDLNKALKSVEVLNRVQEVVSKGLATFGGSAGIIYKVENPQIRFLAGNRLGFQMSLTEGANSKNRLDLDLETGVEISGGRKIKLINTQGTVNQIPLPGFVLQSIVDSVNNQADLAVLESTGLTARILDIKMVDKRLELATFVRFQLPPGRKPR